MSYVKRNWDLKLYFPAKSERKDIAYTGEIFLLDDECKSFGLMRKTPKGRPAYLRIENMTFSEMRNYINTNIGDDVISMEILGPNSDYRITLKCKKPSNQQDAIRTITTKFSTKNIPNIGFPGDKGDIIDFELKGIHPNLVYMTLGTLLDESCCDFKVREEIPVGDYDSPFKNEHVASEPEIPPKRKVPPSFKANPDAPWFEESYIEIKNMDGTMSEYTLFPLTLDCFGVEVGIKKAAHEFPDSKEYKLKYRERGSKKNFIISKDLESVTDTYSGKKLSINELGLDIKRRFNIKRSEQKKKEKRIKKRNRSNK